MQHFKSLFIIPDTQGKYFRPGQPHVGVAYLAGALCADPGNSVMVHDLRINNSPSTMHQRIKAFAPDILGVTVSTLQYKKSYGLINELKRHYSEKPLILGGPHIGTFREKTLMDTQADMAVVGEGELTLREVVTAIRGRRSDLSHIKGLIWRKNGEIVVNEPRDFLSNLDELPFPRYDLFPLGKYIDDKIPILTSRGCPGACVYCSVKSLFGRRFRARSPENVIDEITSWTNRGVRYFIFNDDCFSASIPRAERICDLITEKRLDIRWECRNGIRMDRVTPSLARKMKASGCCFVAFGLESANQDNLLAMGKGISLHQAKNAIACMKEVGIEISLFFMIGTPEDTFNRFLDSYRFARGNGVQEVRFYNALPYPGTAFYDWVKSHGRFLYPPENYLNDLDRWDQEPVFETEMFPREDRIRAFQMGEELVMRAFFKKYFGVCFTPLLWRVYKVPFLNRLLMRPGQFIWMLLRRRQVGKSSFWKRIEKNY